MALSKFRFNKRRKHYSYSFGKRKNKIENILLTSKPTRKEHLDIKKNVMLYKHPNPNSSKEVYIIPMLIEMGKKKPILILQDLVILNTNLVIQLI